METIKKLSLPIILILVIVIMTISWIGQAKELKEDARLEREMNIDLIFKQQKTMNDLYFKVDSLEIENQLIRDQREVIKEEFNSITERRKKRNREFKNRIKYDRQIVNYDSLDVDGVIKYFSTHLFKD